jgi:hypothetical protein
MRRPAEPFAAAVRAFRDLTAATDAVDATRARVLAGADRAGRGHASPRRVSLPTVAALLVVCATSVAGTTIARRWRRPVTVSIEAAVPSPMPPLRGEYRAVVIVPPEPPAVADTRTPAMSDAEAAAYGRAHHGHFDGGDPGHALAAWDDYLRRYPSGTFAPEARFNRALCLVHLGRVTDAERALRPFAEGRLDGYRRAEADRLLAYLRERPTAP